MLANLGFQSVSNRYERPCSTYVCKGLASVELKIRRATRTMCFNGIVVVLQPYVTLYVRILNRESRVPLHVVGSFEARFKLLPIFQ